jgi:hypothetical protein
VKSVGRVTVHTRYFFFLMYLLLFSKKEADKLPPHRYVDHEIPLEDGTKPSFGPLYSL